MVLTLFTGEKCITLGSYQVLVTRGSFHNCRGINFLRSICCNDPYGKEIADLVGNIPNRCPTQHNFFLAVSKRFVNDVRGGSRFSLGGAANPQWGHKIEKILGRRGRTRVPP